MISVGIPAVFLFFIHFCVLALRIHIEMHFTNNICLKILREKTQDAVIIIIIINDSLLLL